MSNHSPKSVPPSDARWYYMPGNGCRVGPFTRGYLGQLFAAGQFGLNDKVWSEGDEEWQQAGHVLGRAADHRPPIEGQTAEVIPIEDPLDDVDEHFETEETEAFSLSEAIGRQSVFDLFSNGGSIHGLTAAVQRNAEARAWLHEHESLFVDLVCGFYFPDLPLTPSRQKDEVELRLRPNSGGDTVWPTEANFAEHPAGRLCGIECLHRYVLKLDLGARGWLEENASHLFELARLVVSHEPAECSAGLMCDRRFHYPVEPYEEQTGHVVVEGEPLNACPREGDHCVVCCEEEELCPRCEFGHFEDECNCGECRRCGETTRDEDICEECECCPKHCKHRRRKNDDY